MGRAPCCDKANVKKGPWSPEEDAKLKSYIEHHGTTGGNWIALPQKIGLKRCGKSCRLRWLNYLRPNIKHGAFSEEEENIISSLYLTIGSRWSIIAAQLPGRTDNDIKNYWNTRLKKKLLGKHRKEHGRRRINNRSENMMKKNKSLVGSGNSNVDHANHNFNNNSESLYWPELPRPPMHIFQMFYPKLEESSASSDQTSLRKLLMKLGGRFSDDHNCESPVMMIQNSGAADPQHPIDHQGSSNYHLEPSCRLFAASSEIEGSFHQCFANPHRSLDGLEFLLGGEGIDGNWGEMSYLGFSSSAEVSCDLGTIQQDLIQECSFNEMRYCQAQ